jgi:hypothetical protein
MTQSVYEVCNVADAELQMALNLLGQILRPIEMLLFDIPPQSL